MEWLVLKARVFFAHISAQSEKVIACNVGKQKVVRFVSCTGIALTGGDRFKKLLL